VKKDLQGKKDIGPEKKNGSQKWRNNLEGPGAKKCVNGRNQSPFGNLHSLIKKKRLPKEEAQRLKKR